MGITDYEKEIVLGLVEDGIGAWLADHYKFLKKDITKLESDVYSNVPEIDWSLGFIICLWRYIMGLATIADSRVRGAANDNSWFKNPYDRVVKWPQVRNPPVLRLPALSYHPFLKISRFRQWQSEDEFRALLPDTYQPPQRASESDKD